ncbi:MAG: M81 family metallopeptidase [Pseudomonadota bacterium]
MTRRIATAGFQHETNTFAPMPTRLADFERGGAWPALLRGEAMLEAFDGTNIPTAGFLEARADATLVPLLWAAAEPGGFVAQAAFDAISGELLDRLQAAGQVDGLYLDLHGAMVTEDVEDGEGELLRRLRAAVGPDLPIVVSLDLHANITAAFAEHASAVAIYRTYPHIDMAATGARAARLLRLLLDGGPLAKAYRQLDYLIPITAQSTRREPGRRLYGLLDWATGPGVASVDFAFGFPPADIADCGTSILAYGTDQAAVDAAADSMLHALIEAEDAFVEPMVAATDAVKTAIELAKAWKKPVVVCDPQDNPGAGATGETTGLLRCLLDQPSQAACLGMLWDPDAAAAAHQAGLGATLDLSLGGRFPEIGGPPIRGRARVDALSDGAILCTGPMYGGATANFGPMARLQLLDHPGEVAVIVSTRRSQNADQAIFRTMGIEPSEQRIVAVKSAVHFLADYEPIADRVIFAEAPGANPCRLSRIPYSRLRAGVRLGPKGPPFMPHGASDGARPA